MPIRTILRRLLRFHLMWVMLLWALTSPGQEEAVYNYLVKGNTPEEVSAGAVKSGTEGRFISKAGTAVSWDANFSPFVVLRAAPAMPSLPVTFAFEARAVAQPLRSTTAVVTAVLQARHFITSVLPNAP